MPGKATLRTALWLAAYLALAGAAAAQPAFSPGGAPANPVCPRLEAQLQNFDRGQNDQIARYEAAANRQQTELDRLLAQSRRNGCEPGLFSLFGGQSQQCAQMNNQIQQMRGNLDQITNDLQRLQAGSTGREEQRRAVLLALAQNNCGPQYRAALQASQPRGFFDTMFGNNGNSNRGGDAISQPEFPVSSSYKTVCVRTCDGFYFPISMSTNQSRFQDDEANCRQLCPAAETALYAFRYPGEDINQAVSLSGRPYTELPNAFRYRQEYNPSCSCRAAGQSWADALKNIRDTTMERGDIVVTGKDYRPPASPAAPAARTPAKGAPAVDTPPAADAAPPAQPAPSAPANGSSKPIRNVGPVFLQKQ